VARSCEEAPQRCGAGQFTPMRKCMCEQALELRAEIARLEKVVEELEDRLLEAGEEEDMRDDEG
jgi:hypothetical protein